MSTFWSASHALNLYFCLVSFPFKGLTALGDCVASLKRVLNYFEIIHFLFKVAIRWTIDLIARQIWICCEMLQLNLTSAQWPGNEAAIRLWAHTCLRLHFLKSHCSRAFEVLENLNQCCKVYLLFPIDHPSFRGFIECFSSDFYTPSFPLLSLYPSLWRKTSTIVLLVEERMSDNLLHSSV